MMTTNETRMKLIFNEWAARYATNPAEFGKIRGEDGWPVKDYGEACMRYFNKLAAEMEEAGLIPQQADDRVPGLLMCPLCHFRSSRRKLGEGGTWSESGQIQRCPNDSEILVPVSWKQYAEGAEFLAERRAAELRNFALYSIGGAVSQHWTHALSLMQQTVLLTAVRGPDGLPKYGGVKMVLRWYRRCVLLSALDRKVLDNPHENNGGSFTGPSYHDTDLFEGFPKEHWEIHMNEVVGDYIRELDAIPHHFQLHFLHAAEIVGYKHPDPRIQAWWQAVYFRLVDDMHLSPESEAALDRRLGDSREGWLERADPATIA